MDSLEVKGTKTQRSGFILMFRVDGIVLAVIIAAIFVAIMDPSNRIYMMPFIAVASGLFIVPSEIWAHEERRNTSSIVLDDEGISSRNDWIDNIRKRDAFVPYDEIDHVSIHDQPTSDGYEPFLLVIHTKEGKPIGSGHKEAGGLREAAAFLEKKGIRVEEHR